MDRLPDKDKEWGLEHDPFSDPEEKRVLFAALDSFRYVVHPSLVFDLFKYVRSFCLLVVDCLYCYYALLMAFENARKCTFVSNQHCFYTF